MPNRHHSAILRIIRENSGVPTQHTSMDHYLGTNSPRYPISVPVLRRIGKKWMGDHSSLSASEISIVMSSMIAGTSSTEKIMAGILLDYATHEQRQFSPLLFEKWCGHLSGWSEVDALSSGKYIASVVPLQPLVWEKIINRLSKSKNIHKRRASLVVLVAPIRAQAHTLFARIALETIDRLKHEKEILITKAISWLLRSMIRHHREIVLLYLEDNVESLPAIAVRETRNKLRTGTKAKVKKTKNR